MKRELRDVQTYQEGGVEATGTQRMLEMVVHLKDENDNTSGSTDPGTAGNWNWIPCKKPGTKEELTHPCLGIEKHLPAMRHDPRVSSLP